jgi:polyamine oxidase
LLTSYFATVTGDESERIERLSDEQVIDEVMDVLKNMYPGKEFPRPKAMHFHRWNQDPLTRGSFANWPSRYVLPELHRDQKLILSLSHSFYVEHQDNLRAPVKNVYFAGEGTSFEYYGYVNLS